MEWIEALRGTVVGLDTAPLIYLIEENSAYLPFVSKSTALANILIEARVGPPPPELGAPTFDHQGTDTPGPEHLRTGLVRMVDTLGSNKNT
jgi:hypothetical protein